MIFIESIKALNRISSIRSFPQKVYVASQLCFTMQDQERASCELYRISSSVAYSIRHLNPSRSVIVESPRGERSHIFSQHSPPLSKNIEISFLGSLDAWQS